jgi:UDP-N-acetylmuramyl pentapeptide phosphotransferase/UDP-N-acetylglucosamine-1-phosphate transferase
MDWWAIFLASAGAFAASWAGTMFLIRALSRGKILDHPNERSSHIIAVPRGGGIAVVATVAIAWTLLAAAGIGGTEVYWILVAALILAAVSWIDDLRGLPASLRLPVHLAAVAIGLAAIGDRGPVFQGLLPPWLDLVAAGFLWVWFLNLFNFMDGIDGLAAGETVAIALGLVVIAIVAGAGGVHAVILAAAALGFWWWNADPARIFLGDVGSVPLGFMLGWLLLAAAADGWWASAAILPLYFLADATLTLLRRLGRRERVWQAHHEHYYQQAVGKGVSHAAVVRAVMVANGGLILLALIAALGSVVPAIIAAVALVAMLLFYLARVRPVS